MSKEYRDDKLWCCYCPSFDSEEDCCDDKNSDHYGHFLRYYHPICETEVERIRKTNKTEENVVHCKRDDYDVYIGRPSKWGNPFTIGKDGTREEVIEKYKEWILTKPDLLHDLTELKNKILGCWCKPHACHGDVLVELIKEIK